jgi:hypothetical protein
MPGFLLPKRPARLRTKILNEKYLVFLLLIISTVTIFVILMKLPPDLQRAVNRDVNRVFMPSVQNNKVKLHNDDHQHPPPPLFNDFDDGESKNQNKNYNNLQIEPHNQNEEIQNDDRADKNNILTIEQKRDKIKEV